MSSFPDFFYAPSPQPTHCCVFRQNREKPWVILWFLIPMIDYCPQSFFPVTFSKSSFPSSVHLWENSECFLCPGSLCQYTLLDIQRPVETGVTHTTRLSFQPVPFPLLWLCGSLLMSPCQLLFSWKASCEMCRHLSAVISCVLLKRSIKNNVTIWRMKGTEAWKINTQKMYFPDES